MPKRRSNLSKRVLLDWVSVPSRVLQGVLHGHYKGFSKGAVGLRALRVSEVSSLVVLGFGACAA